MPVRVGGRKVSDRSFVGDDKITGTINAVPAADRTPAVSQQTIYGGSAASCGQLVVTAANGQQSIDSVTVTIGGKAPTVLARRKTIQSAIDAAKPGDLIIRPKGTYQ